MDRADHGLLVLRADERACFHARFRLATRSSTHRTRRVSSFFEVLPLQSSFTIVSARSLSRPSTLPRFCPSSRSHPKASTHYREDPKPRYVPSSGSLNPTTVFSAFRLRGLFRPRTVSRANPRSGISPFAERRSLIERGCPLAVATNDALRTLRSEVHVTHASASRLCSTRRCVHIGSVISLTDGRFPHRVPAPPGTLSSGMSASYPTLSTRDV